MARTSLRDYQRELAERLKSGHALAEELPAEVGEHAEERECEGDPDQHP